MWIFNAAAKKRCGDKVYRAQRIYADIKPCLNDAFIEVKRGAFQNNSASVCCLL